MTTALMCKLNMIFSNNNVGRTDRVLSFNIDKKNVVVKQPSISKMIES